MAFVLNDRVKQTSTSTGTGTINYQLVLKQVLKLLYAGIGTTNNTFYCISHDGTAEFEVGIGTVTDASPDTLSRDTVISSSNSDNKVDFQQELKLYFVLILQNVHRLQV